MRGWSPRRKGESGKKEESGVKPPQSKMKFENVIKHLDVIERMHRSNALAEKTAAAAQRAEDFAAEFKAARELLEGATYTQEEVNAKAQR
jgi:hypothetical protein